MTKQPSDYMFEIGQMFVRDNVPDAMSISVLLACAAVAAREGGLKEEEAIKYLRQFWHGLSIEDEKKDEPS